MVNSEGCRIADVKPLGRHRVYAQDEGLPLNLEPLWQLHFRFIPFPEELNRYMLTITDLPERRYEVRASGRLVGTWDAVQLAQGVNLSSATPDPWQPGGPWDAQAHLLKRLTEARHDILLAAFNAPAFLAASPQAAAVQKDLDELDASIQKSQRDIARPAGFHFVVRKASETKRYRSLFEPAADVNDQSRERGRPRHPSLATPGPDRVFKVEFVKGALRTRRRLMPVHALRTRGQKPAMRHAG